MPNPTAAMLVIGDEILSGRTREANAHHLAQMLSGCGIDLREIRVVGDAAEAITGAARALSAAHDHVFASGGIGPTHDDITADCIAAAFGAAIDVRADARDILARHYAARGTELNAARLRMARIPEGARLIENPVSAAPGFSLGNVHVMAGVPQIFQAMLAALLPRLDGGTALASRTLLVDRPEGEVATPLGEIARAFPELALGSYPAETDTGPRVAIVLRGPAQGRLAEAVAALKQRLPEARE